MIVPQNWVVDDQGIRHMETAFGELQPVTVCRDPLFVSAKVINVDDNTEKLGITYRRNGAWSALYFIGNSIGFSLNKQLREDAC